ncbi:MAG TPA: hypothetical protein VFQ27_10220 [Xanthobacteraceae bacterium]|nr:hypothetical protein [Xanthobacteraceae bacterium]
MNSLKGSFLRQAASGPSALAAGAAIVLLALPLVACTGESAFESRLYVVQGKFAWQNCEQLTAGRNSFVKQIEEVRATMAKAGRDSGGDFVNATVHRPTLVRLQAEKHLIEETMAEKGCGVPAAVRSAEAARAR